MVGEGLTRARRSARNGMTGPRVLGNAHTKLHAKPADVKPVTAVPLLIAAGWIR